MQGIEFYEDIYEMPIDVKEKFFEMIAVESEIGDLNETGQSIASLISFIKDGKEDEAIQKALNIYQMVYNVVSHKDPSIEGLKAIKKSGDISELSYKEAVDKYNEVKKKLIHNFK